MRSVEDGDDFIRFGFGSWTKWQLIQGTGRRMCRFALLSGTANFVNLFVAPK
jgi:hypothetical protein